ncbi:MAG: hypothetical protein LBR54_05255 [Oscillospiraceae bacterium]|nr:hypothetical protein [Oscillospiraceae bacterium]
MDSTNSTGGKKSNALDGIAAPVLDDVAYTAEKKSSALDDIAAPVLDDGAYTAEKKSSALDDIAAPVLDDGAYTAEKKSSALDDIAAPVLDDGAYTAEKKSSALDDIAAPVLDDGAYTAEKKSSALDDIAVTALLEEPAPVQEYKPVFSNTDTEELKRAALKRSQQAEEDKPIDEATLKLNRMLRAQEDERKAKKGFIMLFVTVALGFLSCIGMYLYSGNTEFKPDAIGGQALLDAYNVMLIAGIGASVLLFADIFVKSKSFKGFLMFVFVLLFIANVGAGGYLLILKDGNFASNLTALLFTAAANFFTCFLLGSSEVIDIYFTHGKEK